MTEDIWFERDTSPDAIDSALRGLLRQRHAANPGLAPARVLNLVVVVDREWKGEVANRLQRLGRYHASRTVLCAVEDGRRALDARAVMSYEPPADPTGIGVMSEEVEIDMGTDQLAHLDTVIDPVVVSELPTMLWSPHGHDEAVAALRGIADVILLDSDAPPDPRAAFEHARDLLRNVYVVDLAWLRTTPWRERLAASFDPPDRRRALASINELAVRYRPGSVASALLFGGWLSSRLGWSTGAAAVRLEEVDQQAPGLAGVTVRCPDGFALSLDREPGGLRLCQQAGEDDERTWKVLGSSRGEAGILGEGVRQALLRDPTYGPALAAAGRLST